MMWPGKFTVKISEENGIQCEFIYRKRVPLVFAAVVYIDISAAYHRSRLYDPQSTTLTQSFPSN